MGVQVQQNNIGKVGSGVNLHKTIKTIQDRYPIRLGGDGVFGITDREKPRAKFGVIIDS
jgi:hypothetical protein